MPYIKKIFYEEQNKRLFLSLMHNLSMTQKEAQRAIDIGRISQNGETLKDKSIDICGEYEVVVFEPAFVDVEVVFENDDFVVLNKPSGLLVHPKGRNSPISLLDSLKSKYGKDSNITHRLDKETSGLVLCSKNREAEVNLKKLFENREVKKEYHALVFGDISDKKEIDTPLLEPSRELKSKMTTPSKNGKESITVIEPLKRYGDKTLLKVTPKTGRTHQIRAHLKSIGHPIVGDLLYLCGVETYLKYLDGEVGEKQKATLSGGNRVMLHASSLKFEYNGEQKIVCSPDFMD